MIKNDVIKLTLLELRHVLLISLNPQVVVVICRIPAR